MLQAAPILQDAFVDPPWCWPNGAKLPGIGPVAPTDWLRVDDAFAAQMALRDRLIFDCPEAVLAGSANAEDAAIETLREALKVLQKIREYKLSSESVQRPDGAHVPLDWRAPLRTLGRLVQEDICLLREHEGAHVLAGAVLCFPASWTLAEKINKPMAAIHTPVEDYDGLLARRVDRMLTALRPGTVLRRGNCLAYEDFALFQPRRESERYASPESGAAYIRSERQCLLRLPETSAIVFSIHTSVRARAHLRADERADVEAHFTALAAN